VLEPRSAKGEHSSNLYCLPADFGWNDLGSWAALYQHLLPQLGTAESNVTETSGALEIEARGNYVYSPRKFVTLLGVEDLVVVETDDAILVTTRARAQDVAKAVKMLSQDHPTLI
jgi:mannose-1-phosphate guanylyltransferase